MTNLAGTTIGVIGLGLMGRPMARNLMKAGAKLVIHNRSQGVVEDLAREGMTPARTPRELAEKTDVVICMLSDTPALETVLSGTDGVFQAPVQGKLIVDMGTSKLLVTRMLAAKAQEKGADYLDAPVSGGTLGAEAGNLTIMAGGSDSAFERALPVLRVLGAKITHVGPTGAGQVAKAANQVIVGLNIGAVAEALSLAQAAGVDPGKVREALGGGFADSRILEVHGLRMVEGKFTPGARCPIQRKDMDQALELAEHLGIELPATALSRDLYDRVIAAGDGDLDHSGLIRAIRPDWPVNER
ncbi:MAG: NAD(P)-dependent oxidoreductase [Rhodospirillales bacterium CG15_BIG_FIL_POST_REV_8_21_14_020_66_15]|nr:MAG: NAD(P)-dependent oxidoreductase [Rhodospirillales bacterium CG15_BIG_FIL_POST_REV_8_21_14_020_66_15]